jgi:integrase
MSRKRRGRDEGSIYQRKDGTWAGAISVGASETGKRKRRVVYGKTKTEVREKLQQLVRDGAGQFSASKLTVAEYLARWLETVRLSRSPATFKCYSLIVRLHISPRIGGVRLQRLEPSHVEGLYSSLAKDGASPRLRQLTHAVLHRALVKAVRQRLVRFNACSDIERPTVARKQMSPPSSEQMQILLSTATGHRLGALFVLAVATGMRQGELLGLHWGDIDLEGQTLHVQRSLSELDGKFDLKEPKSAKGRRQIELPSIAVEALKIHRRAMLAEGHIAGPVFCDSKGGWLRKSNLLRNVYFPLLKKAGLPHFRFHDIRHGHATMMLGLGENPKIVQERLGHAQISLTLDTYSHSLPTMQRAAADRIDSALRRASGGF